MFILTKNNVLTLQVNINWEHWALEPNSIIFFCPITQDYYSTILIPQRFLSELKHASVF